MSMNEFTKDLLSNFELLRNVMRPVSSIPMKVNLNKVNDIINFRLLEIVKDIAPPDFHMLHTDFKAEYDSFKDFILYDRLIGKNVVALGGGFSSGKSSFLNTIMGKRILPTDIDPSTSIPTFLVKGDEAKDGKYYLSGINVFDATFEIPKVEMIRKLSHGFGKIEGENEYENESEDGETKARTDVVTLGHIVESLFFATSLHQYEHLAFLDTPGYSKPDTKGYSAKTDEEIARRQLNTANCILWFVQADAGTITEDDITFLKTLHETTPKLIILNKADSKPDDALPEIISKIKSVLNRKAVPFVDVLAFSMKKKDGYDAAQIMDWLSKWNVPNNQNNFAVNFKKLFVQCFAYYDKEIAMEGKRLKSLNKALTFSDDSEVSDSLHGIIKDLKKRLAQLEDVKQNLKALQTEFFSEIKIIGDIVGIAMPEPSALDLISDKVTNPLDTLKGYLQKKGVSLHSEYQDILADTLDGVHSVMETLPGGSEYRDSIADALEVLNDFDKPFRFAKEMGGMEFQKELLEVTKDLHQAKVKIAEKGVKLP